VHTAAGIPLAPAVAHNITAASVHLAEVAKALPSEPKLVFSGGLPEGWRPRNGAGAVVLLEMVAEATLHLERAASVLRGAMALCFAPTDERLVEVGVRQEWYAGLAERIEQRLPMPPPAAEIAELGHLAQSLPPSEVLQARLMERPAIQALLPEIREGAVQQRVRRG
jgi:hypothetical protein